jgi:hypothetical protein
MTRLISGRVKKIPSANVSASRYQFLKLEEAEPDLGLPTTNGQALLGNVDGTRYWGTVSVSGGGGGSSDVANSLIANANVVLNVANVTTLSTSNLILSGYNGANILPKFAGNIGQVVVSTGGSGAVWSSKFYFGSLPPDFPFYGDVWYDTTDFKLYMWVTDGAGDYWFDFLPPTF